ncbi:TPA: hypothetical protein SLP51_005234, partial [Klebsiella aerogenes]|nr:hypothetical protein [Klebsiella aerogenes]
TQASAALDMTGGPAAPLHLTLNNARVTGGNGTSLVMRDSDKAGPGGAVVSAELGHGTIMTGDVVIEGQDTRSLFSLNMDNATLTGAVNAEGGQASLSTAAGGVWNITGDSSLDSLNNGGTIAFAGDGPGTTLHVRGDYTGNNGLIVFNTVLEG